MPGLRKVIDALRIAPESEALRTALTLVLTLAPDIVPGLVAHTRKALLRLAPATPDPTEAAALRDYASFADHCPNDPGPLSALLLNHFTLRPSEALYLGAGVPHAYFHGLGVELIANSDNVLRTGLTPKRIDVPELLNVVVFESREPIPVRPRAVEGHPAEEQYPVPIDDFRLSRLRLGGMSLPADVPQILLCTEGRALLTDTAGRSITPTPGESCFVAADGPLVTIAGAGSEATVFRASTAP